VFDWIFAFVHLLGLAAALVYAVLSLAGGETSRGLLLLAILAVYYILVLHKPVMKEIRRKRRSG
jgi:membrane protein implicated in regulation of membrane protease activity